MIAAFPLARMALEELESTYTPPVNLMLAFPEMFRAPPAVGSSTMIDWPIVIVLAVVLLVRKFVSPEYVTVIEWLNPATVRSSRATATPLESVTLPRSTPVVASKKSTLPVGVPEPGAFARHRRRDGNGLARRAARCSKPLLRSWSRP